MIRFFVNVFKDKKNKTLLSYFLKILIKNRITIFLQIGNFIATTSVSLILLWNNVNVNFVKFSNIIISVPLSLTILFQSISVFILFSKTKTNNIDLYIYIKDFKNKNIFYAKQIAIFIMSLPIFFSILVSNIIFVIMGIDIFKVFLLFLITTATFIITTIIWIMINSYIAIFLKPFISQTISLFVSFIIIIGLFGLPLFNNKATQNTFNPNQTNNILKLIGVDSDGKALETFNVEYQNIYGRNKNSFSSKDPLEEWNPFSGLIGFYPQAFNKIISLSGSDKVSYFNSDKKFSLSNIHINKRDIRKNNYSNKFLTIPGFKTIFEYKDNKILFGNLINEMKSSSLVNDKISNDNFWIASLNSLKINSLWNSSISTELKNIIKTLLGLEKSDSLSYQIFNNYNLVSKKLIGLFSYIEKNTSKAFKDFIEYLFTNFESKINIFAFNSIIPYENIILFHPTLYSRDKFEEANKYDFEFIKNKYFHLILNASNKNIIDDIQVLDKNGLYISSQNIKSLLNNISTVQQYNDYFKNNSTINNLEDLLTRVQANNVNSYKFHFKNNIPNNLLLNQEIILEQQVKNKYSYVFMIGLLTLGIVTQYLGIKKISRKDIL